MKRFTLAATLGLVVGLIQASSAQTFQPAITQTVGTGSNVSYFVINFNDGPGSTNATASDYAFAYRYDGAETGGDMIDALASQANLGVDFLGKPSDTFGREFIGFSFNGHSDTGDGGAGSAGYWGYFNSLDGQDWNYASTGADKSPLSNGSWDAWSWSPNDVSITPITPVAAPEPSAIWVFALGSGALGLIAIRRRRQA